MRAARLTGAVASAGVLGATVVVAGALTPGYSHRAETISRLGSPGQPLAFLVCAGLVLYGFLVAAAARPLGAAVPGPGRTLAGLLRLYGAASVVAGLAPKDAPGGPHTTGSDVHVAATVVGGAAVVAAMVLAACFAPTRTGRRTSGMAGPSPLPGRWRSS